MRPRLFIDVFSLEARKQLSYRVELWINSVASLVISVAVPYFLWSAIYRAEDKDVIEGYTLHGMLTYYCLAALVGRVVRGADRLSDISTDIYEGGLNRHLIYPVAYLPFKYAQYLGILTPYFVQLVIFFPLFALVWGIPDEAALSLAGLAGGAAAMAAGSLLYYLLGFPLQSVAFWADNVWSLAVLLRLATMLLSGAMVPLDLFPAWGRAIVDYSPFPCLAYLPIQTMLGKASATEWLHGMTVAIVWCGIAWGIGMLVWRRGERAYTGVGI